MVALITPQKITCLPYLKAKETFSVILHFFCRFTSYALHYEHLMYGIEYMQ